MKKHDVKKVRAAVAAMDAAKVPVEEMHRRLTEDDCGIGYKVDIAERTVYEHRAKVREEQRRAQTAADRLDESIAATKQAAVDLLRRELHAIEDRKPGTIEVRQIPVVERIHRALANMEKLERQLAARSKASGNAAARGTDPSDEESVLERIAREEREGRTAQNEGSEDRSGEGT